MKYKFKIILNVLLNYSKYRKMVGCKVKIIKNNGLACYDKYIGTIGYVLDFEFYRIEKPIIVRLNDGFEKLFAINELELI